VKLNEERIRWFLLPFEIDTIYDSTYKARARACVYVCAISCHSQVAVLLHETSSRLLLKITIEHLYRASLTSWEPMMLQVNRYSLTCIRSGADLLPRNRRWWRGRGVTLASSSRSEIYLLRHRVCGPHTSPIEQVISSWNHFLPPPMHYRAISHANCRGSRNSLICFEFT